MSIELDFGQEPPIIKSLFTEDFGTEPDIWQELEKGLADRIAQVQGTKPPPSQQTPAVHEAVPKPSPLHQRVAQARTQHDVTTQAKNHPMVQAATQRVNNEGIQVEDKMPANYTAEQRAQAIHNVANGVQFMHQQFPGMSSLAQRENLKYTLQGPQRMQGGELMGMYHGNEEQPRIEINNAAEQTLWHEHAHFLDHAITGYDSVGTRTLGHPLRDFTTELQNHPVRKAKMAEELAQAKAQGNPAELMNHVLYRHQPEEVFARFFNSHMHYLHQKHGTGQTSEAYEPEYNENWTPEHHEHFGPKLREILRQHELTRSFAESMDELTKAIRVHQAGEIAHETTGPLANTPYSEYKPTRYAKPKTTVQQTATPPAKVHGIPALSRPVSAPDVKPWLENLVLNKDPGKFTNPQDASSSSSVLNIRKRGSKWHAANAEKVLQRHTTPGYTPRILGRGTFAMALDLGDKVARMTSFKQDRVPHPWMVQPVEKGNSGFLNWEIVPKVHHIDEQRYRRGVDKEYARQIINDRAALQHRIVDSGHEFHDATSMNWGYHNGVPTVIDPGAVREIMPEAKDYLKWKIEEQRRSHLERRGIVEKSLEPYVLTKALEETRQGRPLPGTQRAVRTPSAYKIPRKITRPGVRGSTLWWYDERGNVRYGPRPVQREPKQEEPERVKDYLESEKAWSFMSAYSESRSPDQNAQLHAQLGRELRDSEYQVFPSKGYYTDPQGQLQEEPSFLVFGLTTKSALPLGQKYGQQSVLTHHGLFDINNKTLAPIRYKRVEMYDIPKDVPQSVIMTSPQHVTLVVDTGQPVPFRGT